MGTASTTGAPSPSAPTARAAPWAERWSARNLGRGGQLRPPLVAAQRLRPPLVVEHPVGRAQRHAGVDERGAPEAAADEDAEVVARPQVEQAAAAPEPAPAPAHLQLGDGADQRRGEV